MPDAVTITVALVITLAIFLAVRPLWRRRIGTDHGQTVDKRSDPEKTPIPGER